MSSGSIGRFCLDTAAALECRQAFVAAICGTVHKKLRAIVPRALIGRITAVVCNAEEIERDDQTRRSALRIMR